MSWFFDRASKALAVIGVLALMTAGGMQSVRIAAAGDDGPGGCPVAPHPTEPNYWICVQTSCPSPTDTCCNRPFLSGGVLYCCSFLGYNCP